MIGLPPTRICPGSLAADQSIFPVAVRRLSPECPHPFFAAWRLCVRPSLRRCALPLEDWFTQSRKAAKGPIGSRRQARTAGVCRMRPLRIGPRGGAEARRGQCSPLVRAYARSQRQAGFAGSERPPKHRGVSASLRLCVCARTKIAVPGDRHRYLSPISVARCRRAGLLTRRNAKFAKGPSRLARSQSLIARINRLAEGPSFLLRELRVRHLADSARARMPEDWFALAEGTSGVATPWS